MTLLFQNKSKKKLLLENRKSINSIITTDIYKNSPILQKIIKKYQPNIIDT